MKPRPPHPFLCPNALASSGLEATHEPEIGAPTSGTARIAQGNTPCRRPALRFRGAHECGRPPVQDGAHPPSVAALRRVDGVTHPTTLQSSGARDDLNRGFSPARSGFIELPNPPILLPPGCPDFSLFLKDCIPCPRITNRGKDFFGIVA